MHVKFHINRIIETVHDATDVLKSIFCIIHNFHLTKMQLTKDLALLNAYIVLYK